MASERRTYEAVHRARVLIGVLGAVLALSGCTWQWQQYRPGPIGGSGNPCRTMEPFCDTGLACNGSPQLETSRCRTVVATGGACDPSGIANACAPPGFCVVTGSTGACAGGYSETAIDRPMFIDACGPGGMHLPISGGVDNRDDGHTVAPLTIPFTFRFFRAPETQLWPSTNGYAALGTTPPPDDDLSGSGSIPAPIKLIAPFKNDQALRDAPGSDICTITVGTGPDRRFVVEWLETESITATEDPAATHVTFELILNEAGSTIDFVYSRLHFDGTGPDAMEVDGSRAAIGLQGAAPTDVALHRGAASVTAGIRWTPL